MPPIQETLPIGTVVHWWSFTRRPRQQDGYRFALHEGTVVPMQEPFPLQPDVAAVEMVHGARGVAPIGLLFSTAVEALDNAEQSAKALIDGAIPHPDAPAFLSQPEPVQSLLRQVQTKRAEMAIKEDAE